MQRRVIIILLTQPEELEQERVVPTEELYQI